MPACLVVTKYKTEPSTTLLAPVGLWLTYLSSILVYLSLLVKIERISHLFDYVENVVNQSKLAFFYLIKFFIQTQNQIQQQNMFNKKR